MQKFLDIFLEHKLDLIFLAVVGILYLIIKMHGKNKHK